MTRQNLKAPTERSQKMRAKVRREDSGDRRRREILGWMRDRDAPIQGSDLARRFRVSRQCVVQDIAILRAGGEEILATPMGYRLPRQSSKSFRSVIACRHNPEQTQEELEILVDHGVKILDVVVEHPIYGKLRGSLMIESRADLEDFIERVQAKKATLLSSLTQGVHLHTLEASREELITRAKVKLRSRGFLLK
jgi:transcriptional regulator of NAD metabolism